MRIYFLNAPAVGGTKYIREGRCMQSVSSWAAIWPPITLGILAAIAARKSDVCLVDCNVEDLNEKSLLEDIENFRPDAVVINTAFPTIDSDMDIARRIKEKNKDIKTIGFGVYFALLEKDSLRDYPHLDFAIFGEPEETFDELLDCLLDKGNNLEDIKGLIFRRNGQLIQNQTRPFIKDLDRLPYPGRDLFKNEKYILPHNGRAFALINTSRGCPYPCIFCIAPFYYGREIRRHSLKYVMDEIAECVKKYNIKDFLFWEEAFTLDKKYCLDLCEAIIKSNLNISWAATTRADAVDENVLYKMKEARCNLLGLGIESASQKILDTAKKQETLKDIERAVGLCRKVGIKTMGHLIFGLPGETKKSGEQTIKYALRLGLDYLQSYCAVPYPKTELWQIAKKNGWITTYKWSDYNFGGSSILNTDSIRPEEVNYLRDKAFRKFYLRPSFIMKQFFVISSPVQLLRSLNFLKWMRVKK
ncbi:MAG: radical SAM protein [Candidatus Omnitrophota bacterium]